MCCLSLFFSIPFPHTQEVFSSISNRTPMLPRTISFFTLIVLCSFLSAQQNTLRVLTSIPRGELNAISHAQQIVVTFSEPMTALQAVPKDDGSGPLTITPSVKGKYRWLGTSTLEFIPEKQLPFATDFTVKIPAGTKAVSGKSLAQDYSWTFSTPRPRVISTDPGNGQDHVDTNRTIVITFNQPVDPQTIAQQVSISIDRYDGNISYPGFTARRPVVSEKFPFPERTVILRSQKSFGMAVTVTVLLKPGVTGIEGKIAMGAEYPLRFSTYGELKFLGVKDPEHIYPQTGITLLFSNGVTSKNVMERLSFTPSMTTREEYYDNTYPSSEIYLPLPLLPDSTYSGIIQGGLKDQYGNSTSGDAKFSFTVQPYLPFVRIRTGLGVLEGYESHKFPITTMNVDSYKVQMGEVNPERIIPLMHKLRWDYYDKLAFEQGLLLSPSSLSEEAKEFTRNKLVKTGAKRNTVTIRPLNLDEVLGEKRRGVVLVQVDDLHKPTNAYLKALVQVTDFGITAKFSPHSNLIWITNLKDASPVPNASVEIRNDSNHVLWKGKTDAKGLAKTPGWGKLGLASHQQTYGGGDEDYEEGGSPNQWVIVRKGNDIAYTSSQWDEGIQLWRFNLNEEWNPQPEEMEGTVFSDRGLYKAGEPVSIKGIARLRSDLTWKVPASIKVRLQISDSRGEEIVNEEKQLSSFGSFSSTVQIKPTAPIGYYTMRLEAAVKKNGKEQWQNIAYSSFRVEAFRAAEFDVTAKFNGASYIMGDSVSGFFNAKYLYGAPLKNEPIKWRLVASRSSYSPPGFDDFYFGQMNWLTRYQTDFHGRTLLEQNDSLDKFGALLVRSRLGVGELEGTISLMLEGDVTSPTRQLLSGRTAVTVHGGEFYIGVRPSSTFVKSDSTMKLSLAAVTPDGKLLPRQRLSVKIFQRIWQSVRKAETGGRYAWYSTPYDSLVEESTIESDDSVTATEFIPANPGFYFTEVRGTDSRGNTIITNAYFYASGSGYVPWERTNDDRIDLIANKTEFKPGETASIIVKNPYEKATALVTIEREGILRHFTTTLVGSAPQIDIPILSDDLPNIYVSVVLLQGRTARPTAKEEADVGRPSFKVGYAALAVSPKEKKLAVTVTPGKKEYRPGDTVDVVIRVNDQNGKPKRSEVVVSVADLGVLNLIGYRLPDPFNVFYRQRGLAVTTTETRMHIIEQRSYDEKGQEVGGGGGVAEQQGVDADGMRKDFRPSAYWNPSVLTDDSGMATVKFKLPDNLTAFEVMAVAHTLKSDFGYGENSFVVNKPLLLQPSLPRFVRVGDQFKSGVVVMNYSDVKKTMTLRTTVEGLRWEGNDSAATYTLEPGQAKEILYSFEAQKIGTAKFVFRARSDSAYDGLQWTIPVNAPRLKESVALFESTTDPAMEEQVVPPADAFSDIGDIEYTAASTAMTGLSAGISYLFHYPYGCLEQRSSAVLPMILAKDLVDAFHFEVLKGKDYRETVMKTLDEIPLFQKPNGGFSYWKNESRSWSYISAYAMFTLTEAKKNGYQIDNSAYENGISYLKRVLRGEERDDWYSKYEWQVIRALTLYTLALAGRPEFGYMENLYNERNDMPLFAKAYLLKALHTASGNQTMQDELATELFTLAKIAPTTAHFEEPHDDQLWWCFSSTARTTALVLQALVETQPENNIAPKVVRWLIDQQKAGRWRTTQENLYVVDALATYLRVYEKDEPNFRSTILVGGRAILNEIFNGRTLTVAKSVVPFTELTMGQNYPVKISKDGTGRLYYGIRMNYYPKGATLAKEEGLSVVKTIQTMDGKNVDTFVPGMTVKITLTVSSRQDRHFVVVDDPIPAGFEIVNTSFQTSASNLDDEEGEQNGSHWYWRAFNHVEKLDDRVLLFSDYFEVGSHTYTYVAQVTRSGLYQLPATRAEGMYEPEVFGQTASGTITVQ